MINCSHYAGSISGCRKQITSKATHQKLLCVRTAGPHGTKLASGGDRTQPVRSCGAWSALHPSYPHPHHPHLTNTLFIQLSLPSNLQHSLQSTPLYPTDDSPANQHHSVQPTSFHPTNTFPFKQWPSIQATLLRLANVPLSNQHLSMQPMSLL